MATIDFVVKNGLVVNEDALIKDTTDSSSKDTGALIVEGGVGIEKKLYVGTDLAVGSNTTLTGDLAVNGGDLTTTATTFNLLNATATSVNFAGAATALEIGAATGTTNINNNLDVDGDVNVDGGDITTSATTFGLIDTTATTVNFAGAATTGNFGYDGTAASTTNISTGVVAASTIKTVNLGTGGAASSTSNINLGSSNGGTTTINSPSTVASGDLAVNGGDITTNQTSFNLLNTTATTVNFAGAATTLEIGAATGTTNINNNLDVDLDLNVDGGDITTSAATFNLINTTATSVNFAGAATAIEIGAATGTTNINNNLDVDGDVNIDGGDLTVSTSTFNLANTNATTVNFAGSATSIVMSATSGTTQVRNNLDVDLDLNVDGGDITTSAATFNLINSNATTVNFAQAGTTISIGATSGTTTVRNNFAVNGNTTLGDAVGDTVTINAGTLSLPNNITFSTDDATTAGITSPLTLGHTTSGTPAVGIGTGLQFLTETAAGNNEIGMRIDAVTTDIASASEDFDFVLGLMQNGAAVTEKFRVSSAGNGTIVGDFSVNGGALTTNQTSFNIINTTATTVNAFGIATTLNIGAGTNSAQTVTVGSGTGASTYNFGTGSTASGNTKTINVGTNGASGSTTNIIVGVSTGGTLTLNSPAITVNGQATFPSAIANRPILPGGFIGMATGDADVDIWGISEDYYPSHGTAGNAWGIRWAATPNEIQFVGGGTSRHIFDLDAGDFTTTGIITSGTSIAATTDITAGSVSRAANTFIRALAGDSNTAGFEAYGSSQGTGYVFVGQSSAYGGGVSYNGDGSPSFASGETADFVSFYRMDNGTRTVVFDYSYGGNSVFFKGGIFTASGVTNAAGSVIRARYDTSDSYSSDHGWNFIQFGNNGDNFVIGGKTAVGGNLKFVVNQTNATTGGTNPTINGTLALTLASGGTATFGTSSAVQISVDTSDALDFTASSTNDDRGISFNGRAAVTADYNDGYLRLNNSSEFSNGVYIANYLGIAAGANTSYRLTVGSSGDAKIVLNGSTNPYIRWQEGSTDKFYIQWSSSLAAPYYDNTASNYHYFNVTGTGGLILRTSGTTRGYLYWTTGNEVGLLDEGGSWAIRHANDSHTEFYDANESMFAIGVGGISGDYGSVQTNGSGKNSWEGYSINGRCVFMHDGGNDWGIYDDVNNQWMIYGQGFGTTRYVDLRYNGNVRLSTNSAGVDVVGLLTATTKSFLIDHPTKEGMKLQYACLEGPENGVYVRGKLEAESVIELPDYWVGLVHSDSITVNLTPAGAGQQLYVDRIEDNCVYVVNETGKPIKCFYTVYGERKDVDNLKVEIDD